MDQAEVDYRQRPIRQECDHPITLLDDCGRELLGRLGNVSEGGFMAECEEKMRLGSIVQVTLPGRGAVQAQVRWAVGWKFGAQIVV